MAINDNSDAFADMRVLSILGLKNMHKCAIIIQQGASYCLLDISEIQQKLLKGIITIFQALIVGN